MGLCFRLMESPRLKIKHSVSKVLIFIGAGSFVLAVDRTQRPPFLREHKKELKDKNMAECFCRLIDGRVFAHLRCFIYERSNKW